MNLLDKINYKLFGFQPTYSQCGEDVILAHVFRCLKKGRISYLDIGANHPTKGSNTYLFYKKGSKGVCVEPNPELCVLIKSRRKKDRCLNIGVGIQSQDHLDFYIMNPHTLSTFSKEDAENLSKNGNYKIEKVVSMPMLFFNEIVDKYFPGSVPDLVSIDVEGLNEAIVDSIDLVKHRPAVFCIETLTFEENNSGKKLYLIIEKFISNDYFVYADTHLNTIFIDKGIWI